MPDAIEEADAARLGAAFIDIDAARCLQDTSGTFSAESR